MKLLASETETAAAAVVDAAAQVTRLVVAEVRRQQEGGLAYAKVRTLGVLRAKPDLSLGELADRLGVGAPTASKTVEELVREGLAEREVDAGDRRRVTLRATAEGEAALEVALRPALARTAELLAQLPERERGVVEEATSILRGLFAPAAREGR